VRHRPAPDEKAKELSETRREICSLHIIFSDFMGKRGTGIVLALATNCGFWIPLRLWDYVHEFG
jgi:hypothetical protein